MNTTAKPFTGPEPRKNRIRAAIAMVEFESMMVANALSKPAWSEETMERPARTSSRTRS